MSETLLEAGAIRPGPSRGGEVDAMTARAYQHPVLGGRTIVRLVGATVGPAEDLSMEFLGFAPAAAPVEVGHARRQALGFPAWALVNDPANGRHALALVKSMERLARTARSKPGNAMDGYEELAVRLGTAVPAFLPTFWEQAGRAFLEADNQRMAGTCFARARQAEQVHGLVIDEDRLRDVHLEFAFAGALTAAMLTEYARGVVARRPAPEAYELVRTLALQRVAGGLPPHATMAAELARLAKAAGLDTDRQAEEVVSRLLTYPAVARAHPSFWRSYQGVIVRLGKRDAAVRARLLGIVAEPPGWRSDLTDQWLELLAEAGAAGDLAGPPSAVCPAGAARRWLERLLASRRSRYVQDQRSAPLLALLERMLPRLAVEGAVRLADHPWRVELDVLDLCLAGGVRAETGSTHRRRTLNVTAWSRDDGPGRRDLSAIAGHPRWRPMLAEGVRDTLRASRAGDGLSSSPLPESVLEHTFGAAGVRAVLADLITDWSGQAAGATVTGLDAILKELTPLWSPAGTALAPAAFGRLAEIDAAAVVARTLRAGVPAELRWPAYETAAGQMKQLHIGTAWPSLVLNDDKSARVIAPDGTVTEHLFRFPPAGHRSAPVYWSTTECTLVDGELLVRWLGDDGTVAYWSSRPDDLLQGSWDQGRTVPLPLPRGGITTGAAPVHAGDPRGPASVHPLAGDGSAFWRCEWGRDDAGDWGFRWREFDPATGKAGRFSRPAFFAAAGDTFVADSGDLRPAPEEFAASPLGLRDGLVGWRTRRAPDGTQTGEGVDGRRAVLPAGRARPTQEDEVLAGALLMPGSTVPLPVSRVGAYHHHRLRLWTADGVHVLAELTDVSSMLPPLAWWHALRPRDPAGSAALRALDDRTAVALLAVDPAVTTATAVKQAVTANIAEHLPAVTDEKLRARLAEVIARAVRLRRRVAEIPGHLAAAREQEPALPPVTDDALEKAWSGLYDGRMFRFHSGPAAGQHDMIEHIHRVGAVLGGAAPDLPQALSGAWIGLLAGLGAVGLRAASAATLDEDRPALTGFLSVVAGTPLAGDGPPLRVVRLDQERMALREADVHRDGSQITVLFPVEEHRPGSRRTWRRPAVQVAPDGAFRLPEGTTLHDEARSRTRLTSDRITVLRTLLAERGPAPWRPEAAEALAAATGMTRAEAALLLGGLPGIESWQANFLSTGQRKLLGLTPAAAKVARAALQALPAAQRVALLDAAMPADPAALWDHGPDVTAVAEVWIRLRGRRMPVPDGLVTELSRFVDGRLAAPVLQAIATPGPGDWLSTDGRSTAAGYHHLRTEAVSGTPFDEAHLRAAAVALPWLAYNLCWDDPLRAALPEALRLVRERLHNPDLLVGSGMLAAGHVPDVGPALVQGAGGQSFVSLHLAPAKLSGADDPAIGFVDDATAHALGVVLSAWLDEVVATPPGAHGEHRDPRVSVPALVTDVSGRHGLDTSAAAYYLQLLALPDPTDKAVQTWNGWKPAELRAARESLLAAGLVVAAKRERAGRGVFLPGGWRPARAPMLPLESWKDPAWFRAVNRARVVTRSVPDLFAAAWSRITDGDVPRYDDLREKP